MSARRASARSASRMPAWATCCAPPPLLPPNNIGSGKMGKPTGFLEIEKKERGYEKPAQRVKSFKEFVKRMPVEEVAAQAARCMDCGIPFCMGTGSLPPGAPGGPGEKHIPDWDK